VCASGCTYSYPHVELPVAASNPLRSVGGSEIHRPHVHELSSFLQIEGGKTAHCRRSHARDIFFAVSSFETTGRVLFAVPFVSMNGNFFLFDDKNVHGSYPHNRC
jgi:hypothetical protein